MKKLYSCLFSSLTIFIFAQKPTLPKDYLYYNTLNSLDGQYYNMSHGVPKNIADFTKVGTQNTSSSGVDNVNQSLYNDNDFWGKASQLTFNNLVNKLNSANSTISFWYKHVGTGNKNGFNDHKFFSIKRDDQNDYEAFSLGISENKKLVLYNYRRINQNTFYYASLPTEISSISEDDLKTWKHYIVEVNNNSINLYIDNILVQTLSQNYPPYSLSASPVFLGGFNAKSQTAYTNTKGYFDSFIVYNRVLNANEKTQLYNFRESETKVHYDFNDNQMDLYGKRSAFFYNAQQNHSDFTADRSGNAKGAIYTYSQFNNMPMHSHYIGGNFNHKLTNGFTLTTHFKMTNENMNNSTSYYPITTMYNSSEEETTPVYFKLYFMLAINKTNKNLEIVMDDSSHTRKTFPINFKINMNEWNVVTTSFYGNTLKVFVNGRLYHTFDLSSISRKRISSISNIYFGTATYSNTTTNNQVNDQFRGAFDDILIDTIEPTDTDVATLYTALTGLAPEATLSTVSGSLKEKSMLIYPNPTHNSFKITNIKTPVGIEIIDTTGRVLMITQATSNDEINIQKLTPGMYLVKIKNGNETIIKKVIKK